MRCRESGYVLENVGLNIENSPDLFEKLRSANRMVLNTEGLLMDLGVGNEVHVVRQFGSSGPGMSNRWTGRYERPFLVVQHQFFKVPSGND